MSNKPSKAKIGQGALKAAGRKGIKELGTIVSAFPTSSPMVDEQGQLWSATTQAVSQQTGVSQPVQFSDPSNKGFKGMNPETSNAAPEQAEPETNQPEQTATQEASIVDSMVENAQAMAAEQEQSMEMES